MSERPSDPPTSDDDPGHLISVRGFIIVAIAFTVGLLAGAVSYANIEPRAGTGLGAAGGLVMLTMTSLTVASSLHKLLPKR